MNKHLRAVRLLGSPQAALALALCVTSSCAKFDPAAMRASTVIPASAEVSEVAIEYRAELPRFWLTVKPVQIPPTVHETIKLVQIEGSGTSKENSSIKLSQPMQSNHMAPTNNQTGPSYQGSQKPVKKPQPGVFYVSSDRPETDGSPSYIQLDPPKPTENRVGGTINGTTTQTVSGKLTAKTTYQETTHEVDPEAVKIAAQLTSALAGVKNFALLDYNSLGRSQIKLGPKDLGPYVVAARITEYAASVDGQSQTIQIPLFVKNSDEVQRGVVALDVTVTDPKTGQIVAAFPARASFGSQNSKFKSGILVTVYEQKQFAQSVLDQALREATNEIARKLFDNLASGPTS